MTQSPVLAASLRDGFLLEHSHLERLLQDVITAAVGGELAVVSDAWGRFASALNAQLDAEDAELVAILPNERNARIVAQEHRYIREQARQIEQTLASGPLSANVLTGLRDVLRAHARNDDRLMYGWAESELNEHRRSVVLESLKMRLGTQRDASSASIVAMNSATFTGFVR